MLTGIFLFVLLIALVATVFSFIGIAVPFGPFKSRGHAARLAGISFCAFVAGFVGVGVTHVPSTTARESAPIQQISTTIAGEPSAQLQDVAQGAEIEARRPAPTAQPTIRRAGVVSSGSGATLRHTTLAASPSLPPATAPQSLTRVQRNAVRSANGYLSFMPFSRAGLIRQLSSSAGDGYSRADATAAVDSLSVDWNEQAARAADSYLDMMGFSCTGLIEQLSSSAGDQYTRSEAAYGARRAGAC